ncbi:N-acetyl-gamma-glutamyl-phosphate reductase [Polyangium sorediatum]|uniref:N-acetyl-gamma-glutamyl-phosphate reductase n=1 Tax=Polyangium sorediatum TaxID=889274 RepID=A0ABT6NRK0_9BACT|nr:N-acetyl-gamma-glutamyl-phosphate reductase [Polyangium sorediatum]MDI1430817.1 N-acetyl-gamma-glutamyl-phosphate reductase [Polyangium sorediatum]
MSASKVPVSILGVSGFAGSELARLVADHDSLSLVGVAADRWQGSKLGERVRVPASVGKLPVAPMSDAITVARQSEVALLATPAEVSAKLAPELLAHGVRVVDLSGAFRLEDPAAYPRWYGFDHPAPELLAEAHYGLPEVASASTRTGGAKDARLIANPGCYATAAILALAPLVEAGAIDPGSMYVDGKSGVSGAGRKVEERLLFMEVDENLSAYRVGNHQHTPEIEQALSRAGRARASVTFVPHLLPVRRGLLVTAFARLSGAVPPAQIEALFRRAYAPADLVEVRAPEDVTLAQVAYTPYARLGVRADAERGSVVVTSALDNLLKGAASQALQNLCAMIGAPPLSPH